MSTCDYFITKRQVIYPLRNERHNKGMRSGGNNRVWRGAITGLLIVGEMMINTAEAKGAGRSTALQFIISNFYSIINELISNY